MPEINLLHSLEEKVLNAINRDEINKALELVQEFVRQVVNDSRATANVFGSEKLDRLCLEIGKAFGKKQIEAAPTTGYVDEGVDAVVSIASHLEGYGGHTLVLEDVIKAQPDKSHIVLVTDLFNLIDAEKLSERFSEISQLRVAPRGNAQEKLNWLAEQLNSISPARIFLFNHHQDAVAIAGIQSWLGVAKVAFYHHADHNLCLGVHLPKTIHIDPHNIGYYNCREHEGLLDNKYVPLIVEDKGSRSVDCAFLQEGILRTCSAGSYGKFASPYVYSYVEIISKRLALRDGIHFHIGNFPEGVFESISNSLREQGIDANRFIHVSHVPSLWSFLVENRVDLYISSFPLGGGRAAIESMGSGTPLLIHQSSLSRFHGGIDLAYHQAFVWSDSAEFGRHIASLTPEMLAEHSYCARQYYELNHLPSSLMTGIDCLFNKNDMVNSLPPPLKNYRPDYLQRYLHFRSLEDDLLRSQEVVLAAKDDELHQLRSTIQKMSSSYSWRITAPLRWVVRLFK